MSQYENRNLRKALIMSDEKNKKQNTFGLIVLLILIGLLLLEFLVANIDIPNWIIIVFGFLQAGIILWNYMHLGRFFIEPGNGD
jgi:heme/copper-type cytochrome/quinol oxidase subunit 4